MRLAVEIVLVALAALGALVCLVLLPEGVPGHKSRSRSVAAERPDQLIELERLVVGAQFSGLQAHAYLRPLLTEIVDRRLALRGQGLEAMTDDGGRNLLGTSLWELVRSDRPFPERSHPPGVKYADLAAMLDVIEGL